MDGKCNVEFPVPQDAPGIWHDAISFGSKKTVARPPVVLGNGCQIFGDVADYTVCGEDCIIEEGATVINSILWPRAVVKAGTHLENCVVGGGVMVKSSHAIFNGLIVDPHRPA
jgi:NDP-sugar pyrophosphorylase family protein